MLDYPGGRDGDLIALSRQKINFRRAPRLTLSFGALRVVAEFRAFERESNRLDNRGSKQT
jgi:hypothetical protein